jgi:hypothetical protein
MRTLEAWLVVLRNLVVGPAWGPLARMAWCRKQRGLLRVPGHPVVWVGRESVPWAEWGAARGYFDLERMDGIPYLMGAPAAPAA